MAEISEPKFSTTWFSIQWMKARCQPNMSLKCNDFIVSVLETGLLFREDSLEIEDALQIEHTILEKNRKRRTDFLRLTPGERVLSAVAVGVCISVVPMRFPINNKSNLYKALCWAGIGVSVPMLHRWMIPNNLPTLLQCLTEYTTLVRKCMSCIKEQSFHSKSHCGMSVDTMNSVLLQQHRVLCSLFNKGILAIQNACPWLSSTTSWEISFEITPIIKGDNLGKLHHLFLILQSTLLKNIAMIHLRPPLYATRLNKNHNEKIYWTHSKLVPHVLDSVQNTLYVLNNAYRFFKEFLNRDVSYKSLPKINHEPWQYSEVHASVVLCSTEIRSALTKANEMDTFLEACWNAKSKFSPAILEDDLSKLKDDLIKCIATVDNTGIQLKKIRMAEMKLLELAVQKLHLPAVEEEEIDLEKHNTKVIDEDTEIDVKDQVFYYEKTEDDKIDVKANDYLTGPGKEEIQATKVVLNELKRKLVKKEDEMRQREAIALESTMPEYKGKIPDFPRQILLENVDPNQNRIELDIKNEEATLHGKNDKLVNIEEKNGILNNGLDKIVVENFEIKRLDNTPKEERETLKENVSFPKLIDTIEIEKVNEPISITGNNHVVPHDTKEKIEDHLFENNNAESSQQSSNSCNKESNENDHSDFSDSDDSEKIKLLQDIRKNRITKKKNYPSSSTSKSTYKDFQQKQNNCNDVLKNGNENNTNFEEGDSVDEGLKPVQYTFGTGMAMASLLHISRPQHGNQNLNNGEEVFVGDGEVSEDSGNET